MASPTGPGGGHLRSAEHRTQIDGVPGSWDSRVEVGVPEAARKEVEKSWSSALRVPSSTPRQVPKGQMPWGVGGPTTLQRHRISGWERPNVQDYEYCHSGLGNWSPDKQIWGNE